MRLGDWSAAPSLTLSLSLSLCLPVLSSFLLLFFPLSFLSLAVLSICSPVCLINPSIVYNTTPSNLTYQLNPIRPLLS